MARETASETDRVLSFAEALKALAVGDVAKAAALAETLRLRWPEDAGVHQLMAAVGLTAGRAAEAERWALSSLALRPDHVPTLALASQAAASLRKWPAAVDALARVAELDPARPDAIFPAAAAWIAREPEAAAEVVEAVRARRPRPAAAWAPIGAALEKARKWSLAADAFRLALEAEPAAGGFVRFGSALHALGRRAEAATAYQTALKLDPRSAEAWFKLGLAYQDSRRPDRAEEAYRRALEIRPGLAEAEANLGVVLQAQGDLEGAKRAYGRAILAMPSAFGRVAQALGDGA